MIFRSQSSSIRPAFIICISGFVQVAIGLVLEHALSARDFENESAFNEIDEIADVTINFDFDASYSKCSSDDAAASNYDGSSAYYIKCEANYKKSRICPKGGGICQPAYIDCTNTLQPLEQRIWCNARKTVCTLGPSCVVAAAAGLVDGCIGQPENGQPLNT